MTNLPFDFQENPENSRPKKHRLPPPPLKEGQDPIPFLFWNMLALAQEIEELREAVELKKEGGKDRDEHIVLPEVLKKALENRESELDEIPEDAVTTVPWDEFYLWLDSRESKDFS